MHLFAALHRRNSQHICGRPFRSGSEITLWRLWQIVVNLLDSPEILVINYATSQNNVGVPKRIRTSVFGLSGRYPGPLDDGDSLLMISISGVINNKFIANAYESILTLVSCLFQSYNYGYLLYGRAPFSPQFYCLNTNALMSFHPTRYF